MRIAFLILAHHKPYQLRRLVSALQPIGSFFIHVDADSAIEAFCDAVPPGPSITYLRERESVRWASFDIVRATLKLLRTARAQGEFDYFVLLSGVDYPITSNNEIVRTLESGGEHIRSVDMPHTGHPLSRLNCFFVPVKNRRNLVVRALNRALRCFPWRRWRRGALRGMTPASGSQWWALSAACIDYVLRYVEQNPGYSNFLQHSQLPDEFFFQTILRQSPFASQMRWTPTYDVWTRPAPPYPATLVSADFELLRAQSHLFARKFDIDADPEVFDRIDRELRR